jgi:hypothetical protein
LARFDTEMRETNSHPRCCREIGELSIFTDVESCQVPTLVKVRCLAAGSRAIFLLFSGCLDTAICLAQDLAPRAYVITPLHSNAINLTYSYFDGGIIFDGTVPVTGATARVNVSVFTLSHSFNFFGRTATFTGSVPYGVGNFRGTVVGAETVARRSGLLTSSFRFSVNLIGGPAMDIREYRKWRQKTIVGVSFKLVPSTGSIRSDQTHQLRF